MYFEPLVIESFPKYSQLCVTILKHNFVLRSLLRNLHKVLLQNLLHKFLAKSICAA